MKKKIFYTIIAKFIWCFIWQKAAMIIDNEIFLPSPADTFNALIELARTPDFFLSILTTLKGIAAGFLIGFVLAVILAVVASLHPFAEAIISLPVKIIKCIPVASIVILALLWFTSARLSIFISAIMVLPVIYTNLLSAISETDIKLLQMAKVFTLTPLKKFTYIYLPTVIPGLTAGVSVAAGLAWKSGIAAEIIGLIKGSIGNSLYISKMYLETGKMFAWTATIIIISIIFEKLLVLIIKSIGKSVGATSYEISNSNKKSNN